MKFIKYPRTEHLLGSKFLDRSNFDLKFINTEQVLFPTLKLDEFFVVEEKMDGIGLGICFINEKIYIQQRSHLFSIDNIPPLLHNFKQWIQSNEEMLYVMLESRHTLFGEWLEYKHTVFYNNLPSFFLEYDIYDHIDNLFLSTQQRRNIVQQQLFSAKVVATTSHLDLSTIKKLVNQQKHSYFSNSNWQKDFQRITTSNPTATNDTINESFEGFYIKVENSTQTNARFKWINKDFFRIVSQNQHWKNKHLIRNQLINNK